MELAFLILLSLVVFASAYIIYKRKSNRVFQEKRRLNKVNKLLKKQIANVATERRKLKKQLLNGKLNQNAEFLLKDDLQNINELYTAIEKLLKMTRESRKRLRYTLNSLEILSKYKYDSDTSNFQYVFGKYMLKALKLLSKESPTEGLHIIESKARWMMEKDAEMEISLGKIAKKRSIDIGVLAKVNRESHINLAMSQSKA